MIKIDSLTFSYKDGIKIFENFTAEFRKGERACLRADSGIGKTTLLRLICSLEKPQSGKVSIKNDAKISFCSQQSDLFPWYTALKNVSVVSDEESAKELLLLFELSDSLNKYPKELSGGMKKRVSLARAVAHNGDILLIDEGFTGLEQSLKEKIMDFLKVKYKDKLILFSTHDDFETDYFATRVIKL